MLHTGSRALGQAIRDHHLACALGRPVASLEADSDQGRAYLADMEVALAYTRAHRDAILEAVVDVMRERFGIAAMTESRIDCHHNFVRAETHGGENLLVHRKGAISAAAGEVGIIPGSMGSVSFHVEGRGCAAAMCSASHGAGRRMSRHEARLRVSGRDLAKEMRGVWFDARASARLCDEAPSAYKDIEAVMRAQRELVKIVRRLRPLLYKV
jgi:tRNA-splicing ligase RtcB